MTVNNPPIDEIRDRLTALRENIEKLQPDKEIKLVAVSKTASVEAIRNAFICGQRDFGENRVQAFLEKRKLLSDLPISWHFIGHIQTNKVRHIVDSCDLIHSVDSERLLDALSQKAHRNNKVLLQVNTSGEASKWGLTPSDAVELYRYAAQKKNIEVTGLMTMAPFTQDQEVLRKCFASLKTLADRISADISGRKLQLSMGMTGDYKTALSEGADILRIGSAIFG